MSSKKVTGRSVLSLEDRVKVIKEKEKGNSERKIADMFKCGKTQINTILKSKDNILVEWEENKNRGAKRKRQERFGDVNDLLFEWFRAARAKLLPISGPILKEKSLQIADQIGAKDFSASNGWLDRFRTRHNIQFRLISGEAGEIDSVVCEDWKGRLDSITEGYAPKDIFNMDETGLFFRALPTKTLALKSVQCKGGKLAKERLTVALCVNGAGEKEQPLVIGKSLTPRCFKNADATILASVTYRANKKAWMTTSIFEEWLLNLDKKMGHQKRNILLFLDNATCHAHQPNLKNIKLQFLPPNTTSHLQPL